MEKVLIIPEASFAELMGKVNQISEQIGQLTGHTSGPEKPLSRREAASLLGVSLPTLVILEKQGRLVPVRAGAGRGRPLYAPAEIRRFLSEKPSATPDRSRRRAK